MFTVSDILNIFLDDTIIANMGNWYPRVIAVMSCFIPAAYIIFAMVVCISLMYYIYRGLAGGK